MLTTCMYALHSQGSGITQNTKSENELQYDTLILFKNHALGLAKFNRDVVSYNHEPAIRIFANYLILVMTSTACSAGSSANSQHMGGLE